ncbi:MAG TPA: BatA and WFA domain-containing protein, partial [Candidatus Methylacidiphilales bacterium]|nr:BatA and WFA domain-containing protein [Candidatus Methylacidiphilales bacterium]
MINFLNPWFLLGLAAIGAPVWLHLRRKDREQVVPFTGLRFLEDQPVAKQPPLQLKNILLFLLRVLALALLVAAFARPYFAAASAAATSSRVFVIDNTLSRQAENGLEHDKKYVLDQIAQAGAHEQVGVVVLGSEPRVVVNFGDSPQDARQKIEAVQPTTERGTILSAVRQADFLLRQSIGETKQIIVLSDFQKNQWTEDANAPPFLAPGEVKLPFLPTAEARPNFFVAEPRVQRVFIGDGALIQFTALIGRTGDVGKAVVSLTSNGREILHRAIALPANTDKISVITQWEADPATWLQGSLSVTADPDVLPQDNACYFTVPPITEGRVALLSDSIYLQTALSGPVAHGHWKVETLNPTKLVDANIALPDTFADILMVDGDYLQSAQARMLVDRYFQAGRCVFIMANRLPTLVTGFLEKLGFDPLPQLAAPGSGQLAPLRYFSPDSPVFKPFLVPDFCNILDVRVGEPVHLSARDAKPILFGQNGDVLLFDGTKDNGRFLLATFAFDRKQTDWVIHPSFVPFLDSALQYLRPQVPLNDTLEPGEIWLAQIPAELAVKTVVLSRDGKEVVRTAVNADHRALLRVPDEPGIYGLSYDQSPEVRQMLSVNPSERESELTYFTSAPDILKAWTLNDEKKPAAQAALALPASLTAAA